jgi:hypothetical protein
LRIDEPMSLPASSAVSPAARAAAEPPDDPPGARERSQGLLVVPAIDEDRVGGGPAAPVGGNAPGRRQARDVERFLDRDGQAVQRAPRPPPGQRAIGRAGAPARGLDVAHDDRIEGRIVLLDPRQVEIEQLVAADLLLADVRGESRGRTERDVEHAVPPPHATLTGRPGPAISATCRRGDRGWRTS